MTMSEIREIGISQSSYEANRASGTIKKIFNPEADIYAGFVSRSRRIEF